MKHSDGHRGHRRRQAGAAGIEFVFVFVIFLAILYGIFAYGFVFMLQQGLTQAAAEGARATKKVDPLYFTSTGTYQAAASTLAESSARNALGWLPTAVQARITVASSWTNITETVNSGSGKTISIPSSRVTVTVTYPGYSSAPIIPTLTLPGIGDIPQTPTDLVGKASS